MFNFGELKLSQTEPTKLKTSRKMAPTSFKEIVKEPIKRNKDDIRMIEPGFKIGTGSFLSVAKYCNSCGIVHSHCHKPEKRRFVCLYCKTITTY